MVELESILKSKGKDQALNAIAAPLGQPGRLYFCASKGPGLGHAIWCARHIIGDDPFSVLLADDFILDGPGTIPRMAELYQGGAMVATMDVPRDQVSAYGIVDPGLTPDSVQGLVEKPSLEAAPSTKAVIGRYILPPEIIPILGGLDAGRAAKSS